MWIRLSLICCRLGSAIPSPLLLRDQNESNYKKILVPRWVDQVNTNAQKGRRRYGDEFSLIPFGTMIRFTIEWLN